MTFPMPDWKPRRSPERPNVLPLVLRTPGVEVNIAFGVMGQLVASTGTVGEREIDADERRIGGSDVTLAVEGAGVTQPEISDEGWN